MRQAYPRGVAIAAPIPAIAQAHGQSSNTSSATDGAASNVAGRDATCPVCGSRLPNDKGPRKLIKRGALVMRGDPVEFDWNGQPIPLSPMELNLMVAVMVRGQATLKEIGALLPQASRRVVMYKIRSKFHLIGAADPLQTIPNWGLKLRVEADRDGTKTVWIGTEDGSDATPSAVLTEPPPLTREALADAGLLAPARRPSAS